MIPVLLALAVCLPALAGGFVIDDAYLIVDNPALRELGNIPSFFVGAWGGNAGDAGHAGVNAAYYRPLTMTLQALEHSLFGARPAAWHLVSAVLHAAATGLVVALALRLLRSRAGAVFSGAVFAVHPVHTEAVAAACYQTTLLAAVLALTALVVVGRTLERGCSPGRVCLGTVLAVAAAAAKEEAAIVPLLAAAWIVLERGPGWRRALVVITGPMVLAMTAFVLVRAAVVTASSVTFFAGQSQATVVRTMFAVAGLYAGLLVLPLRLCPFYDWFIVPPETTMTAAVVLGVVCVAAWAGAAVWSTRRAPAIAVALTWIPLGLLPVVHLVPILNVAAERFLYLPSVGFALAVGGVTAHAFASRLSPRTQALFVGLASAVVLLLGLRTLVRWPDWRDDTALNRATAEQFPETPTPLLNLASQAAAHGRIDEAVSLLAEAQRRAPGWPVPGRMLQRLRPSVASPPQN